MDSKGFFGNWIVRNLILAVVFVLALVLIVDIVLKIYTHHGREVSVPDMSGMSVSEAAAAAANCGLDTRVADSVYVIRLRKGAVFSQNPKAGSKVKSGRKISLTINANSARRVAMPLLVGYSMRQAKAELLSRGLNVGKLIYTHDMATNNVLRQLYRGTAIEPGTMIEAGSAIDLVVGLNDADCYTIVPDLTGVKYLRALDVVVENSLNVGNLNFDGTVRTYEDTLNAVVYSQRPSSVYGKVVMGEKVNLYFTLDESRVRPLN